MSDMNEVSREKQELTIVDSLKSEINNIVNSIIDNKLDANVRISQVNKRQIIEQLEIENNYKIQQFIELKETRKELSGLVRQKATEIFKKSLTTHFMDALANVGVARDNAIANAAEKLIDQSYASMERFKSKTWEEKQKNTVLNLLEKNRDSYISQIAELIDQENIGI
jgi:hypothetical protein